MLLRKRLVVERMREDDVFRRHHLERQVRGVSTVCMLHDISCRGFDPDFLYQIFEENTRPVVVKATPFRHTMKIGMKSCLGKRQEVGPGPDNLFLDFTKNTKPPVGGWYRRSISVRQDGKFFRCELAGWRLFLSKRIRPFHASFFIKQSHSSFFPFCIAPAPVSFPPYHSKGMENSGEQSVHPIFNTGGGSGEIYYQRFSPYTNHTA